MTTQSLHPSPTVPGVATTAQVTSCGDGPVALARRAHRADAKILPTLSSEKNSTGEVTPATTRAKPSIAS